MEGFGSISDLVPATPPLPPPPFHPLTLEESGRNSPSSFSYSLSLLVITAIIAFVIIATASIHLLLRFLSRTFSSSSPQLIRRRSSSSFAANFAASSPHDQDQKVLVDSLPLFSLAHSLAALPKSSPDCAVCLSAFRPHDELRLLPACRHAFHAPCIDTWLRSSPSCPLCRSTIALPPPPALPLATAEELRGSEMSFRIEIGNVSRRSMRPPEEGPTAGTPRHGRSYSLGTSFEYVVEEEVLARLPRMPEKEEKEEAEIAVPLPPGVEVAEAAGELGRGWLKEYVDRLASSASSSFNSFRFSGRWRLLFDGGDGGGGGGEGGGESLDFQLEESGLSTFYRWLTGV